MELTDKKILLGLTGSIACYKAAEIARELIQVGANVQVVMTHAATKFITPITMQALTNNLVYTDVFDTRISNNMPHIELVRNIDAMIICPCSANFIFKMSHGVCDDLLSTLYAAKRHNIPIFIAPAMNVEMWHHEATKRNIQQLKIDGVILLGPDIGQQICGEFGLGHMLKSQHLIEAIIAILQQPKLMLGKKLLLTAGPTIEFIDPIRVITNLSSGKMGYAIAGAAYEMGADVTLVSGPTALEIPYGVKRIDVNTAIQMHTAVMNNLIDKDIFISVAAVADWKIAHINKKKLKKTKDNGILNLKLKLNPDILASVAALPKRPYCVGFASESNDLIQYAEAKRLRKNIPLLVSNIGPKTFNKDKNALTLFDDNGYKHLPYAKKKTLARQLMQEIAQRLT